TSSITYDIGCESGALLKKFYGTLYGSEWDTSLHASGILYTDDVPANSDLVSLSHTLEHLPAPITKLTEIRARLAPRGMVFIEVPNVPFAEFLNVINGKVLLWHLFPFTPKS